MAERVAYPATLGNHQAPEGAFVAHLKVWLIELAMHARLLPAAMAQALIQQRVREVNQRHWPAPFLLPSGEGPTLSAAAVLIGVK